MFEFVEDKDKEHHLDEVVDTIRSKYGFTKLVYTSSLLRGGRAIARSKLVGGHAGGMSGLDEKGDADEKKNP
ncbi:hypothetical protein AOC36_06925 [Erysipelothrix larvae]|uniref:DNA polymerase Y-family little finger domain-containing protein n=1 Tax=Erysipelothrix larvae TaxID=1514105 RepID=A0A0X8H0G1_9FIRM|nr:hypothetical protein [Erysipelothrix larvae]AMC93724.1 hypothetical protein AOC36_06925 [Erysipelothrix larvae]